MKLYVYPALLFEEDGEYYMSIPDLNLLSVADSSEEVFVKAKSSLKAYFELAKRYGTLIPFPSTYEQICKKNPKKKVVMLDVAVKDEVAELNKIEEEYNRFMKMFFDED